MTGAGPDPVAGPELPLASGPAVRPGPDLGPDPGPGAGFHEADK